VRDARGGQGGEMTHPRGTDLPDLPDLGPLNMTPVEVPNLHPVRATFLTIVALALVLAAVVGLVRTVFHTLVMPQSDRGHCFIFDKTFCSDLSVSYIEEVAGLHLPANTDVVHSSSSEFLFSGTTVALLHLPEGAESPLGVSNASASLSTRRGKQHIIDELRERGVTAITGTRHGSGNVAGESYASMTAGTDEDGSTWVYIHISKL
jgi:hypothetical protein